MKNFSSDFRRALAVLAGIAVAMAFMINIENDADAANTNWKLLKIVKASEMRGSDAGTTGTYTVPLGIATTGSIEVEDVLVKVDTAFTYMLLDGGILDAGADTVVMDVGVSGALEQHAKDVNLKATGMTVGSSTTSVKPRLISAAPVTIHLGVVGGTGTLVGSKLSAGQARVYVKAGAVNTR